MGYIRTFLLGVLVLSCCGIAGCGRHQAVVRAYKWDQASESAEGGLQLLSFHHTRDGETHAVICDARSFVAAGGKVRTSSYGEVWRGEAETVAGVSNPFRIDTRRTSPALNGVTLESPPGANLHLLVLGEDGAWRLEKSAQAELPHPDADDNRFAEAVRSHLGIELSGDSEQPRG